MALTQVINDNYDLLHRSLNPSSKLFVKLRSVAAIAHHLPSIKQEPTVNEKNAALFDTLLDVLDDRQEQVMNEFIAALRSTGQDHVANIFRPESNDVPMSDEHYNLLTSKRISICQFIKPKDGLADHLVASGVLSDADRTTVLRKPQIDDMAEELVNILLRKSDSAFGNFVNGLNETGQSHVAYLLTGIGPQPMSHQHRELLRRKMDELCKFVNVQDGLLERLVSRDIVSLIESESIRLVDDENVMAKTLLITLLRKQDDAFDAFRDALNYTGQHHVSYILTGEGGQPLHDELRNTPMSDEHRELLRRKMDVLCEFLDVENGLLNRLLSKNVVSLVEADRIRSFADYNVMAKKLVSSLLRKYDRAFDDFIEALNYTGQRHVTYILTGEGDCRPLNDELRIALSRHRKYLIDTIDSMDSSLVTTLMSKGVFSSYDEQRVVSVRPDTCHNRNEIILNLAARKSQSAFSNFIKALNDTDQTHVVVQLIGQNIFLKMKTVYDSRGNIGDHVLPNIDAEILQYVREMFESNGVVVQRLNRILSQNGVAVIDVTEGCIQVTFTCKTLESLKNFQKLCTSGDLEKLLNEAFCSKFADKGLLSLTVEISDEVFNGWGKIFLHSAPMTSQHRKALESSEEWLVEKMTISDDLLDRLKLCKRRRQAIERAATRQQEVKTLLGIVSRRPDVAFEQLLCALNDTQQQETAEMLRANSENCAENIPAETKYQLPVIHLKRASEDPEIDIKQVTKRQKMEEKYATFKNRIRENFGFLLKYMDPSNELLGELMSVDCVKDRAVVIIQFMSVDVRATALLTALLQIPDEFQESVMSKFVSGLKNNGQGHVANIFCEECDKVPTSIPMSAEHRTILIKHTYKLCQFLDPENGLLDKLVSSGVISVVQDRRIRSKNILDAMVRELIDTILKKSDDAFQALIQALNETGQLHVTYILTGHGSSLPLTPALTCDLIAHRQYMVNAMEAKNSGLVSALITKGVFSQYDEHRVKDKYSEVDVIVNETILDLLMRKSQSSFDSFIEALTETRQEHVATELQKYVKMSTSTSAKQLEGLVTLENYHKHALN